MPVTLHIERLVLDGLSISSGQRALLQAAVEAELVRLLTEAGIPASLSADVHVNALRAAPIQLGGQAEPATLGAQIARSVYGSFGGTETGAASTGDTSR